MPKKKKPTEGRLLHPQLGCFVDEKHEYFDNFIDRVFDPAAGCYVNKPEDNHENSETDGN